MSGGAEGETLVQYQASTAPQTKNFDLDTPGVSRLLIQGDGDANTTVGVQGSYDGGATYVAMITPALITAPGVIVNCAPSKVRVQLIQATTTVTVHLAVSGIQ
jgi:hypothetical protein